MGVQKRSGQQLTTHYTLDVDPDTGEFGRGTQWCLYLGRRLTATISWCPPPVAISLDWVARDCFHFTDRYSNCPTIRTCSLCVSGYRVVLHLLLVCQLDWLRLCRMVGSRQNSDRRPWRRPATGSPAVVPSVDWFNRPWISASFSLIHSTDNVALNRWYDSIPPLIVIVNRFQPSSTLDSFHCWLNVCLMQRGVLTVFYLHG